ncbi:MAG: helix-turn-helix transcriptional regulator [Bacteroidales bacterium]|nr:helix-turn-helix transcriptional regulator [Bacteroidales bacterium]
MDFISFEEHLDQSLGKVGTPRRDAFEAEMEAELEAWKLGELVRQTRKEQNLTQKQLGEIVGVGESQISKIESGKASTFTTISRVFKALGASSAVLDLGKIGRVALW